MCYKTSLILFISSFILAEGFTTKHEKRQTSGLLDLDLGNLTKQLDPAVLLKIEQIANGDQNLLAQDFNSILSHYSKSWDKCSALHGINKGTMAEDIEHLSSGHNLKEKCALACIYEDSGLIVNGQFEPNLTALTSITIFGWNKETMKLVGELIKKCNADAIYNTRSCKSADLIICFDVGMKQAGVPLAISMIEALKFF